MNESSRHYAGWRAAFACAAGSFFASFPYYTFALFLKPVSAEFSWSRESVAAAYATMAFTAAAAAPFLGRVIDRVGARRVIVPALIVLGLAVASLSMLTPSLQHLYAVGVVIGVASIGAWAVAYARVIFGWFDTYRGRALGIMLAGGMVSTIVLPPIVVRLIDALGWRTSWGLLGVVMLVGALPIVVTFLHEKPAARTGPQKVEAAGYTVGAAIRTRRFWTLIIVIFGAAMLVSGSIVHVTALLTDRGFSPGRAAAVMSVMGAANLGGRLLTGWLLDRYAAPRVAATLLTAGAIGGLLMSDADSFGVALIAAFLIGGGSGGEIDVNPYLLSRYFGLRSLATLYGLNWMALGVASAIGPVLMGRAFDSTGSYTTILVRLAFVTLLAAALALTLPGSRESRTSAAQPAGI